MTDFHACTIVSNNYLAYARVFTRSLLELHPGAAVHVLIVDRPAPGHRYEDEPFSVAFVEELAIPGFPGLAFRSTLLELNTAAKPFFLRHLHRELGCAALFYFDPDILITGDLGPLVLRLAESDALLTPHLTAPLEDGKIPSERDILLSGVYNLGFLGIAFNERTLPFLDWWGRRLLVHCRSAVHEGLFVDQRWMDLAPSFLARAEIVRDPGCNAAYWNLAHRRLAPDGAGWTVEGRPLRFFHFSGIDPARPELVSKYQDRITFAERPDVAPLFAGYLRRLEEEGHAALRGYPYAYGLFRTEDGAGAAIPDLARSALRLLDPEGRRWPDPFAGEGAGSYFSFLREAVDPAGRPPLPRLALLAWDERPDLQERYPEPTAADREELARWFVRAGDRGRPPGAPFTEGIRRDLEEIDRIAAPGSQERTGLAAVVTGTGFDAPLPPQTLAWLLADAGYDREARPLIPRLALQLLQRRNDLAAAHPDPLGADRRRLALWFVTHGWQEYRLPGRLLGPVLRTLKPRDRVWAALWRWKHRRSRRDAGRPAEPAGRGAVAQGSPAPGPERRGAPGAPERAPRSGERPSRSRGDLPGVDVVGYPGATSGVGEACRGTLAALAAAEVPVSVWALPDPSPGDGEPPLARAAPERAFRHGLTLFHVNADGMPAVRRELALATALGRRRAAVWFWELAHLPLAFAASFRDLDEIWAPSRFCAEAFLPLAPIPVRWVPPCVPAATAAPASRRELGVPQGSFLFYFAFDALSVPERKNPLGLLDAFGRAAREAVRPVHLLLKVQRPEAAPETMEQVRARAAGLPVTLLEATLGRPEQDSLLAASDAYVSLHRSEGLGLPLIEAMHLGKPVVATGYGGVTDFLDDSTGSVVPHRLVPLERNAGPYPAGAVWAEPDLEEAAERMLALAADPASARERSDRARRRVADLYAPEAAGARFRREVERLLDPAAPPDPPEGGGAP